MEGFYYNAANFGCPILGFRSLSFSLSACIESCLIISNFVVETNMLEDCVRLCGRKLVDLSSCNDWNKFSINIKYNIDDAPSPTMKKLKIDLVM